MQTPRYHKNTSIHTSGSLKRNVQNIYILKVVPDKLNQKFSDKNSVGEATFTLSLEAIHNTYSKAASSSFFFLIKKALLCLFVIYNTS